MNLLLLFADAGPGPLLVPIVGGLGIAGVFLAAAVVAGGVWLFHGPAAPRARKFFLITSAVLCLGLALLFALLGETQPFMWIGAVFFGLAGVAALVALRSSVPALPVPDDSVA